MHTVHTLIVSLNHWFITKSPMSNLKQKRLLTVFPWHFIIVTIVLYSGVLYSFGINRIALGILTIIWYPYLCYYLTNVEFYDNYMIIRHPLLFFGRKQFCMKTFLIWGWLKGKEQWWECSQKRRVKYGHFLHHYWKKKIEKWLNW